MKEEPENKKPNKDQPYVFEVINKESGLLDKCLDATYIIHLEGNEERKSNITEQTNLYNITKNIIILNNKGFKKCKKNLREQTPVCDLIDCYIQIFKNAEEKDYNNILILEDDFIFNEKIKDSKVIEQITEFINAQSSENNNFIYLLGTVPYLQLPSLFQDHSRVFISTGTHSCVYSKQFRKKILEIKYPQDTINDWDVYTNLKCPYTNRYIYKIPLCYQLFYESDNFNSWKDTLNLKYILLAIFKFLNMDKNGEPGFTFFYKFSKIFYLFIIVFIYSIVFYIGKTITLFINQLNFFLSLFINKFRNDFD
jgi:hypothetical protein